ncbi:MAG: DUF1573 domain-containing protein [Candidatus Hydrogenedentes bacterium]|nr:DUF1573 domain-containing protein [Candidatus Hydrogenedentota bacterium]
MNRSVYLIRAVVLWTTALCFLCGGFAQAQTTPAQPSAPRIELSTTTLDLGKLQPYQKTNGSVSIKNTGASLLVISNVTSSCGCTAAVPGKKELAPDETTSLDVTFKASSIPGKTHKTVTIRSNDPNAPKTTLNVTAEVIARATVEPRLINLGSTLRGHEVSREITVTAADDEPDWTSVKIVPSLPTYSAELIPRTKEDIAARRWRFKLTLKKDAPRGRAYASISVMVNDEKLPVARATASAIVEGKVIVTPAFVSLYSRDAVTPARSSLLVQHRDKKAFKITSIECDVKYVKWQILTKEGSEQHEVKLTLAADTPLDTALRGKLTIHTDVPGDETISVPVSARRRSTPIPPPRPRSARTISHHPPVPTPRGSVPSGR